eukprot:5929902-Alexandrium_andersonii.AAC.1
MEHAWLLTDDGQWHELSGPCLLGQHGSLPIQRDGGVFWLDVEVAVPQTPRRHSPSAQWWPP